MITKKNRKHLLAESKTEGQNINTRIAKKRKKWAKLQGRKNPTGMKQKIRKEKENGNFRGKAAGKGKYSESRTSRGRLLLLAGHNWLFDNSHSFFPFPL